MRLSEAIRLGAMLKPQGFGRIVDRAGGSCALGAALDAVGECEGMELRGVDRSDFDSAVARWPILERSGVSFPADPHHNCWGHTDVLHMIWGLNDNASWTREQIADWIESIERTDEALSPAAGEAGASDSGSTVSDAQDLITGSSH